MFVAFENELKMMLVVNPRVAPERRDLHAVESAQPGVGRQHCMSFLDGVAALPGRRSSFQSRFFFGPIEQRMASGQNNAWRRRGSE